MIQKNIAGTIICLMFLICINTVNGQSVTIDLSNEYQVISGFGGMNHTTWIKDMNEDNREKAFGNEPGKIGLSILRIHLDPDSNRFNLELPTASAAKQKGAKIFATPWNAPDSVLDPNATQSRVDPGKYAEYVDHLNRFNTFMADSGVPLFAISVQNEPDYGDWTRWTSNEMVAFLKDYGKDIENTVIAPESFQFKRDYTDPILNDTSAVKNVDIIGGHIYGGGLSDYQLARDKGKEVWMTEHLTGSEGVEANTWSLALDMGTEINECMKANFNAYVWWYIRRFYSLINDGGNITKKGFVMSHYSKFIRPGAIRVDGLVTSATNVDVTAYKTDTTLTIVVINKNDTAVNLDFTIQNGSIDTLTKFTTSDVKNVMNDGGISISGGLFTASVDAKSITTFTSYGNFGGTYSNVMPLADAGSDIVVVDSNKDGKELILLDGSASNDPDGEIINYSWSVNGIQVSLDTIYSLSADLGEYEIILTVTDNDGAVGSDTMNVTVESTLSTEIYLDAECAQVGATWEINNDANASNGKYVNTPTGTESVAAASADTADLILFTFHVTEPAPYKLWARVITPSANDDSFWIRMDEDSTWAMWNSIPASTTWQWQNVFDQSNGSEVVSYILDTGYHVLSICFREDGAKLDKILLVNSGITPDGLGETDTACPIEPGPSSLVENKDNYDVRIFPNPAKADVNIETGFEVCSFMIFNLEGRVIESRELEIPQKKMVLTLNLEPGIYLLRLNDKQTVITKKLIIN